MPREPKMGRVRLVGAGPGAADLLTVRALHAIQGAQALLYDALIEDEVIELAPSHCVKIQTGKRAGRPSMKQATINRLMLRLARRGLVVVRLKGGDPSIFGRVGEELAFLEAHGVATEVIPGVTAACAAAAQFGFPLTHRGIARSVVFTTARVEDGALQLDWSCAANRETTLAIYMGGAVTAQLVEALLAIGRSPRSPALLLTDVSRRDSRIIKTTLAELGEVAVAAGPALLVIGDVARAAGQPGKELALPACPAAPPGERALSFPR